MKVSTAFVILLASIALTACSSNMGTETESMKPAKEEAKPMATEAVAAETMTDSSCHNHSANSMTKSAKHCHKSSDVNHSHQYGKNDNPSKGSQSAEQQCAAAGGSWGFVTRGAKGCKYTYSDGGKACSDAKQCQAGACLAKSVDKSATLGACPANTSNKNSSCFGFIRNSQWFPKPCF